MNTEAQRKAQKTYDSKFMKFTVRMTPEEFKYFEMMMNPGESRAQAAKRVILEAADR